MELTLRPYVAAGVALTAAGAIALAPLAPPAPEIHVSAPRAVSEAVQLSAVVDPITALANLVNDTVTNLQGLAAQATSSPQGLLPILKQFLINQVTYAQDIGGGLLGGGAALLNGLLTLSPMYLQEAALALQAGEFTNAAFNLTLAIYQPVYNSVLPINAGFTAVFNSLATHITKLAVAFSAVIPNEVLPGFVQPLFDPALATGVALDNVAGALNPVNPVALVEALLAAPIIITDGILNGIGNWPGLLTVAPPRPDPGPISALLVIRNLVAAAIDPPLPSWLSGLVPATATPMASAKTVTLNITPPTGGSRPLTANTSSTKTGTATPAANSNSLGKPGKASSANVEQVFDKAGDLGLKHLTGKSAKK